MIDDGLCQSCENGSICFVGSCWPSLTNALCLWIKETSEGLCGAGEQQAAWQGGLQEQIAATGTPCLHTAAGRPNLPKCN